MGASRHPYMRWGWLLLLVPAGASAYRMGDRDYDGHRGGETPWVENEDRVREMREERRQRQEDYHHRMDEALAEHRSRLEDWKSDQEAYKEKMKALVESFRERVRNAEEAEKERLKEWLRDGIRELQRELRHRHAESVESSRRSSGGEAGTEAQGVLERPESQEMREGHFRKSSPPDRDPRSRNSSDSKLTDDQIQTIRAKWKAYLSEKEAGAK